MTRWWIPGIIAVALHVGGSQLRLPKTRAPRTEPSPRIRVLSLTPKLAGTSPAAVAPVVPSSVPAPAVARPAPIRVPRRKASRPRPEPSSVATSTSLLAPEAFGESQDSTAQASSLLAPLGSSATGALTPSLPPLAAVAAGLPAKSAQEEHELRDALQRYARLIRSAMQRAKRYPDSAMRRRHQGSARVQVQISANGTLAAAPVLQGSTGFADLDREILRMATSGAPYPRPPKGPHGPVSVLVPVNFRLSADH